MKHANRMRSDKNESGEHEVGDAARWTPEVWSSALAAMRERASAAEILALYEGGAVTALEVLDGAWSQCYNAPALRADLVRQFRAYPSEYIADIVGGGLEMLANER